MSKIIPIGYRMIHLKCRVSGDLYYIYNLSKLLKFDEHLEDFVI